MKARISAFLLFFATASSVSASSQVAVSQPHVKDKSIVALPVPAPDGYTAELTIQQTCLQNSPILSKAPVSVAFGKPGPTKIELSNPLLSTDTACVIEKFIPQAGQATIDSAFSLLATVKEVPAESFMAGVPVLGQPYTSDAYIFVDPASMGQNYLATLTVFNSCEPGADPLSNSVPVSDGASFRIPISLRKPLEKGDTVCVSEVYAPVPRTGGSVADSVHSALNTVIDRVPGLPYSPSTATKLDLSRISGGLDISSSASVDPGARFLLDAAFDFPFSNRDQSLYNRWWGTGYIRLGSIAQPGAISGLSGIGTYVKPLTDSTPDKLVQSVEGNFGVALKISESRNLGAGNAYTTVSVLVQGGVISPLSVTQASPVIYSVTQDIYNFYTGTAPINALGSQAASAIVSACGKTLDPAKPCYLSYIPQDRTRFFRNYSAGFLIKRYYYKGGNTSSDDRWTFPGMVAVTFGQNEYVTRGQLRGYNLHIEGSWPLPGAFGGKFAGGMYVFGALDTNVSDKNASTQQFILPTASSTVTLTSPGVAVIPVAQPNRDRYRLGVAIDLVKLVQALNAN